MKFSRKKLPKDAIQVLRRVPIELYEAHRILLTPVYVFLPKNQKFVALKAHLQHFSAEELEKFKPHENFYVPAFIEQIAPFQRVGESVRNFLAVQQKRSIETNRGQELITLPAPQNEFDNAIVALVGTLWGEGAKVEPFFLCFFMNEVCSPLPTDKMMNAIDQDAELFELALLRSSAAVFLGLHIGYTDSKMLVLLRDGVFEDTLNSPKIIPHNGEIRQMIQLIRELIPNTDAREISLSGIQKIIESSFAKFAVKVAKKLHSRLKRVEAEFILIDAPIASLFGDQGLIDE